MRDVVCPWNEYIGDKVTNSDEINLSKILNLSWLPANWTFPARELLVFEHGLDAPRTEQVTAIGGYDGFGSAETDGACELGWRRCRGGNGERPFEV
jgi:hypothetical protein